MQAENNAHSMACLKQALCEANEEEDGPRVLKFFLFVQICKMCGVTGTDTLQGTLFLTELNARTVLLGVRCLEQIQDAEPGDIYWRYIASRGEMLRQRIASPEKLAFARLL